MYFVLKLMSTSQIIFLNYYIWKRKASVFGKKIFCRSFSGLYNKVISFYAPNLIQSMSVNSFQGPGIECQGSKGIDPSYNFNYLGSRVHSNLDLLFSHSFSWSVVSMVNYFNAGRLISYSFDSDSSRGDVSQWSLWNPVIAGRDLLSEKKSARRK